MTDDYTPLDPDAGPTVWARQLESNQHTVKIVTGKDPTDPRGEYILSHGEIRKLKALVARNS